MDNTIVQYGIRTYDGCYILHRSRDEGYIFEDFTSESGLQEALFDTPEQAKAFIQRFRQELNFQLGRYADEMDIVAIESEVTP